MRFAEISAGLMFAAWGTVSPADGEKVVYDFTRNTPHAYAAWEDKLAASTAGAVIDATAQGGLLVNDAFDLSDWAAGTPAVRLRILDGHTDTVLRVTLRDADGTAFSWDVPLESVAKNQTVTVHAGNATALTAPTRVDPKGDTAGLDLAKLRQFHIQGSWRAGVHVQIALQQLLILPNKPEFAAMRREATRQAKAEAERRRKAEEAERKKKEEMARRLAGRLPVALHG